MRSPLLMLLACGLGGSLLLTGCSSPALYENSWRTPRLQPADFFNGVICADGVVEDYAGDQIRHFNALIQASWQGDTGTLDEVFYFHDAPGQAPKRETRIWTLKKEGDVYRARATDVPQWTTMAFAGNSLQMQYTLEYGEPGDTISLSMDDRMVQVSDGVVVNETSMSKLGFTVGKVLLVMRKADKVNACAVAQYL